MHVRSHFVQACTYRSKRYFVVSASWTRRGNRVNAAATGAPTPLPPPFRSPPSAMHTHNTLCMYIYMQASTHARIV